jgi:hypothetical protein
MCFYASFVLADRALQKSRELAERHGWSRGRENAFRHAYWMGLLTIHGFTFDEAIRLGVAHEKDTDTPGAEYGSEDSNADLHNNEIGARLGVDIRPRYAALFGVGDIDEMEQELEERIMDMDGGTAPGKAPDAIRCTSDGCLAIVER